MINGISPYALVHGFFGATPLATTLGALASIPADLPVTSWMRSVRAAFGLLNEEYQQGKSLEDSLHKFANESIRPRTFKVGDYVLVFTPDKSAGYKMRSRGTGPFIITTATPNYVHLQDPFTG